MTDIGRPRKYTPIINQLDPHTLYTPATIAKIAVRLSQPLTEAQEKRTYTRVRIAFGRFSNNHDFPDEGDGMVTIKGQAPCPAWFGWRWQKC